MNTNYNKSTIARSSVLILIISTIIYFSLNGFNLNGSVNTEKIHNDQKYSQVRILAKNDADFSRINQAGLYLDGGISKPGNYFETWLSENEIQLLRNSGVPYEIITDDWDIYYNNRQNLMTPVELEIQKEQMKDEVTISHSIYGTLNNGAMKYSEVVQKLDSMRNEYPNLISQKWSIGNTYENRTMWCVRITKGPNTPTGRPEVMYHAVIHAREPEGMEQQFFYMYWLLENYNIDPIATYILNNREIYWIPVYNIDGYVYNEPGGGMWRCNRHITTGNCGPVDLNRNYGTYQFWNSTNNGSSTDPCNGGEGTYRGTNPFSEIESMNILTFTNSRNIKTALTGHTYGNYLIRPWAWSNSPTVDDYIFQEWSIDMTQYNHYTYGRPMQTVGYQTRGGSDDWNYNDSGHTKIMEMTPETGLTGFWPTQAELIPLAQGMLYTNQYIALVAGPYVIPISKVFNQATYTPGQSGNLKVKFRNKGIMTATNVNVSLTPGNNNVTIPTQLYTYASLATFVTDSATFNFTISVNAPNNCAIPTVLKIKLDTSTIYTANLYINIGNGTVTLNDDAEAGMNNWTPTGSWALKTDYYHSGTHSFGYAPYPNNANYSLTLTQPINMQSVPVCYLTFWQRYGFEANYDFGYVEVSSNNGSTWQTVSACTGVNLTWTQQSIDITDYVNASTQLKIRFRLFSDAGQTSNGWWVDDINLTNYCINPSGIRNLNNDIPKTFALEQNYPNPFNPSTHIKFQLPRAEFVTITIFDMLGKKVETLVSERKNAGYYDVSFDGTSLASGMYFYKIEAGNFTDTKKMILIK
jgi:carboxypeptidase T